ncbi:MAG: hypothetical protein VCB25_02240, partial [Myxococcota bacterium]
FVLQRSMGDGQRTGTVPLGEPLLNHVRPRPGSENLARGLLADVYLIDRLEEAFEHFGSDRLPAIFVTRNGDLASPNGVVSGGGDSTSAGIFTRAREVRELEVEVAELDSKAEVARANQMSSENELVRAGEELENLRNRHHTAALAVANHEKDLERSTENVKRIGEAQQNQVAERSDLIGEQESLGENLIRLGEELKAQRLQREASQRAVDAVGLEISSAGRESSRRETKVTELRVAYGARDDQRLRLRETATRAAQSQGETRSWITRLEEEIESARMRRETLLTEVEKAETELATQLEAEEVVRLESDRLRERFDATAGLVSEVEEGARGLRTSLGSAREKINQAELKQSEARMRLDHQTSTVHERWEVDIEHWKLPTLEELEGAGDSGQAAGSASTTSSVTDPSGASAGAGVEESEEDEADLSPAAALRDARQNIELAMLPTDERQREAEKVRKGLSMLGDVNLGAIEEHEELAERFRFLSEQKEDLEGTIHSLREAISRINRTSRKRFRETFEQVRERFEENFPRLFGGGKASLELTEAEDILEAGVDIMAQPPGKRLQNVNLLSGGEKTMTALALLVAVFQVRPSPFFLLDEVDAALDDANV